MNLSAHFTLDELTFSQVALRTGNSNDPTGNAAVMANLARLCAELLEPARVIVGVALHVDSGYRSEIINDWVGGARNSAHVEGRAADLVPIGMPVLDAFQKLMHSNLPYDQIIFECQAWIHIAVAPSTSVMPRREALLASGHAGAWSYTPA